MKVGTDGVLLGAWVKYSTEEDFRVLDIGSGSGLISLMLAQRYPQANIVGIDIDQAAIAQSQTNFSASPWEDRLAAYCTSLQQYSAEEREHFDLIVSNPPFFQQSLTCPDLQRTQARHTQTLSYEELLNGALSLLTEEGQLQLILPAQEEETIVSLAKQKGLHLYRICRIRGRENKPTKRILLHFGKTPSENGTNEEELTLETQEGKRTMAYQDLCKDFYL